MPHLAGHAVHTTVELAVEDQRAADAGGDGHVDHVVVAAARAQLVLGQRGGVGVVVQPDRHLQPLGQHGAHGQVVQRDDVAGFDHHAVFIIDKGRKGCADAAHVGRGHAAVGHELPHLCGQMIDHFVGFQLLVRQGLQAANQVCVPVEQSDLDVGAAYVNANRILLHSESSSIHNLRRHPWPCTSAHIQTTLYLDLGKTSISKRKT